MSRRIVRRLTARAFPDGAVTCYETAMTFTLADLNEAIADAVPEREAIVTAARRVRWRDLQLRTRRLAQLLQSAGLGCRRERDELAPWESGQDHLALYLYNGSEYLEGMIGATKARVAAFNVNYRYVEDELAYLLLTRGRAPSSITPASRPGWRGSSRSSPRPALLLQVDDGSGEPLLPGALDYEARARRLIGRSGSGAAERRRSLHRLHRRHDRDAERRPVAPARRLLRRDGRAGPGPAAGDERWRR